MVIDKINVRQHSHMRSAELTTPAASPVAATPVVVMAAVGVAAVVSGFGWAYGW